MCARPLRVSGLGIHGLIGLAILKLRSQLAQVCWPGILGVAVRRASFDAVLVACDVCPGTS